MVSRLDNYTICFLLFHIILLLISVQCFASSIPYIKTLKKTDYKGGQANRGFVQDKNGNLYIANSEGLLVFNGENFELFPINNKTQILSISMDSLQRVFVGGQGEFGYFTPNKKGGLNYHSLKDKIPATHQNFSDIRNICVSKNGIYFKSLLKIFYWDFNTEKINVFETGTIIDYIGYIDQKLYIDDQKVGLSTLENNQVTRVKSGSIFSKMEISSVLKWDNDILIATWENGIFWLKNNEIQPFETEINDLLKKVQIKTATISPKGKLILGTVLGGIYTLDKKGNLTNLINKEKGLKNNAIQSLYYDQYENLWVGLETGMNYIKNGIPLRFINPSPRQELIGYIAKIHNDKLYLATSSGLYFKDLTKTTELNEQEYKFVKNSDGLCWNLSEVDGVLYLHKHEGFFKILNNEAIKIRGNGVGSWVTQSLKSNPDKIIEGTYLGINIYDKNGKIFHIGNKESSRIIEQSGNEIWVSHDYKGAYKIVLNKKQDGTYSITHYDKKKGFPSDIDINVFSVNDEIVFTSEKGIYKYDSITDSIIPHHTLNKIFGSNSNLKRLVQDDFGRLWFVEQKKVGYINLNDFLSIGKIEKKYLPKVEGLLAERFQYIYPYSKDKTYFGTENGFIEYLMDEKNSQNYIFDANIVNVSIAPTLDSTIFKIEYLNEANKAIINKENIHYKLNSIRFEYGSNYFNDLDNIFFSSKLEGFENEWVEWSKEKTRTFTNLPSGNYTFLLKAKNSNQTITSISSFTFSISSPWYLSSLAKLIYFLLALIALYLLWSIPRKKHQIQTQDLKQKQKLKLNSQKIEYDEKIKESERELMKIKNEKLTNDVNFKNQELGSLTMHLVQKRETLVKIKEELSKVEKIEEEQEAKNHVKKVIRKIERDLKFDNNWEHFEKYFDEVHIDFMKNLRNKYPQLTNRDYKLCAFLRMNLSSKEIASLLNITTRSVEVSRHRLRKKLNLTSKDNLVNYIMNI